MSSPHLISIQVSPDIAARLEHLARATERPESYLAVEAIEEYLDLHEWQIEAIKIGIAAAERSEFVDLENVKKEWGKRQRENSNH